MKNANLVSIHEINHTQTRPYHAWQDGVIWITKKEENRSSYLQ